ncbi:DUF1097 domain-containing protein [Pararhizobium sp. PWRC1-1]|uniref:DUF1097 domain-containing protein n=1 Tax=Pararhizobium sp. PWRC1-1 TaxID=2804566 RepID=UPI003CEB1C13
MTFEIKAALAPTSVRFTILTLAAALTAAIAATASASLGWPVWAMFMGWVAFFVRGHSASDAFFSYLCLVIGIAFGVGAAAAVGALIPLIGPLAFGPVVFVVAIVVVSLRALPPVNNVPAYFLGLITLFAAHLEPGILAFSELAAVSGLGSFAAWIAHKLQTKIMRP